MPSAVDPIHDEVRNEQVIYQNPLLFLKIWEIAVPEVQPLISKRWPWHYHKEVEFLVILEGSLGIQTKRDYRELKPGDVFLLGASQLHRTRLMEPGPVRYVVFQVDLSQHFDQTTMPYLHSFSELTQPLGELNYIFHEHPPARSEAYALIMDIFEESRRKSRGYELAVSAAIKRLLLLLLRSDTRGVLDGAGDAELMRLRPALDYIDAHLGEKISVEDACALLNLSYHYFIKYFKRVMGLSFIDYVNYKRVKKAERLLLTRNLSVTQVGCEVGIPNMAQFYKLFKRHNQCSPKEFKQRMKDVVAIDDTGA